MSEPELSDDVPEPTGRFIAFTQSQRAVYDLIRDHGLLHYFGAPLEAEAQLRPRLYLSRSETENLLEIYGLKQLAAGMGMMISADDVDYSVSGMRALESLKTRLLLENLRRRRRDDMLEMIGTPRA